ncbi:MAG: aldo/keto reductase [Clostridia bacterium]|nr:aldo/keto reductase [Clostridia bacterium]
MEYTTLGKTGLRISRMGFGGIPIQKVDVGTVRKLMESLAEKGVNYIDTARGYTVSESYLGEALEGMRDKFVIATKSMARTKEAMEKDIEISLANLRTDYIDLYQVHNPSLADLQAVCAPGGALEALQAAKAAGRIGHIGVTAHMATVFEAALEMDWVETIMFPYNIVETQGEALMRRCTEKNIGFIVMKPLAGGALEDAALAMRFIAANPDVSVVIPGMYDQKEIDQNLAAMEDTSALNGEELAKIETIRRELGTQFCRRCNYCQPCTAGIGISGIFVLEGYLQRYGLGDWAKGRYAAMAKKAGDCVDCGVCEARCPYQLPIREMLKRCKAEFGAWA